MKNKVAMITGASVGIGRSVAIQMAEKGAKLVLIDVNAETLQKTADEIKNLGASVLAYVCDISDEEKVKTTVADALEKFGSIDILINNAALWRNFEPFVETSTKTWKTFFDINVFGTVYCTRAVLPKMIEKGYGRIINVSSVAGVYGNANMSTYSATKGAVIAFSQSLAKEVIGKGIIVNCVSPGTVSDSGNPDIDSFTPTVLAYAGRTGTNRENADLICFLASENNGYIVGQNIQIDGCRKKI